MKLRRLAIVFAAAAMIAAIPISNSVFAQKEEESKKATICHFPDGKSEGIVIEVANAAVQMHIKMHGDSLVGKKGGFGDKCIRKCDPDQLCKKGEVLDPKTCRCEPTKCQEEEKCKPGTVWDPKKCQCVPDGGGCKEQACEPGSVWSSEKCACVPEQKG